MNLWTILSTTLSYPLSADCLFIFETISTLLYPNDERIFSHFLLYISLQTSTWSRTLSREQGHMLSAGVLLAVTTDYWSRL